MGIRNATEEQAMSPDFSGHFPDTNAHEIGQFEKRYGFTLPQEYKQSLLKCNGGAPGPLSLASKYYDNGQPSFVVRKILPLADYEQVGFENLDTFIRRYKVNERRVPDEMIPVASDPFGNLFCLAVSGEDAGKVYFWDHEQEPDDEDDNSGNISFPNIRLIADDFSEFLRGLRPLDQ